MKIFGSYKILANIPFPVLVLLMVFPFNLPCLSQKGNPAMEELAGQVDSLTKGAPPQLIYLQTSKGVYEPMEDLWFKAYVMDSRTFAPSSLCRTLYLEMSDESTKQVVWREKYEVQDGFVDGHVYIHDTLSVGDYILAAFTGGSFYGDSQEIKAVRRVQVREELRPNYDGWIGPAKLTVPQKEKGVQFNTFPEGGNLVAGIQNRLAFKAVNPDGTPVDVRGTLFEGQDTLLRFNSAHDGMGSFVFTPIAGKKYNIRLSVPATDSTYLLPEVLGEGISLRLAGRDKEFLEFRVTQSPGLGKRTVYLRGQIRGIVCCIAMGELSEELTVKIPLEEFPFQGIAEFTLFTENLGPAAERLVYVNPEKRLFVTTELDKTRYGTREKATLKITVKDENGRPVPAANLGVSVYDKFHQNPGDPLNIFTYCYLYSQLRGNIYDPAYYFDEKNVDREEDMDLLMLTQGWRRYFWSGTAQETGDSAQEPGNTGNRQLLSDWVDAEVQVKPKGGKTAPLEQVVKIYFPNKNDESYLVIADSAGKFAVAPEYLKAGQGTYVYLQPMAEKGSGVGIALSDPFQTIDAAIKNMEISYPVPGPALPQDGWGSIGEYIEGIKTLKLDEVTVTARGSAVFRDKYIGKLDSIARLESPEWVCRHDGTKYLNDYKEGYTHEPTHNDKPILREKPVIGEKYVMEKLLPWDKMPGYYYITDVIYNFIYPGSRFTEEELLKMNNLSRLKAYYIQREFYQPFYDDTGQLESVPDFRNNLYWGPLVVTDEKGGATVEFFCSDLNTGFIGTIEGVSGDGLLCNESFEFSVIKAKPAERGE